MKKIALSVVLLTMAASARATTTIEWVDRCKSDDIVMQFACRAYLQGIYETIQDGEYTSDTGGGFVFECKPIQVEILRLIFVKYIGDNPKVLAKTDVTPVLATFAFLDAGLCNTKKSSGLSGEY